MSTQDEQIGAHPQDRSLYSSGQYWDSHPGFHEEDSAFKFAEARKLLAANQLSPASILDCGCGGGLIAYLFAEEFKVPTTGLDLSESSIARARERHRLDQLDYVCAGLEQLDDNAVELGLMFDVFEHVDDYLGFLHTARNKAAKWLFNIPLDMSVTSVMKRSYMQMRRNAGHLHYFSEESGLATLESAGFEIIDSRLASKVAHELSKGLTVSKVLTGIPQYLLFKLSPHWSARLLGGASLLVLAQGRPD